MNKSDFIKQMQEMGVTLVHCPSDPGIVTTFSLDTSTGKVKNLKYEKVPSFNNNKKENKNSNAVDGVSTSKLEDKKLKDEGKLAIGFPDLNASVGGSWKKQQIKKKKGRK